MPKFFRVLICVVLICCILVNASPIKARATDVVISGLGLGLFATLIAASGGVVFDNLTTDQTVALGQNFKTSLFGWASSNEEVAAVNAYFSAIASGYADDLISSDWKSTPIIIPTPIRSAIAEWISSVVQGFKDKYDFAPTNWSFYGDNLLPTFPIYEEYPYMTLVCTDWNVGMLYTDVPACLSSISMYSNLELKCLQNTKFRLMQQTFGNIENWNLSSSYISGASPDSYYAGNKINSYFTTYLWSNYDLLSYNDGSLLAKGSSIADRYGTVVVPGIIAGSPAIGVDGVIDTEEIEEKLPYVLDPSVLIDKYATTKDLTIAVPDVMTRVATGAIPYADYVAAVSVADWVYRDHQQEGQPHQQQKQQPHNPHKG